MTTSNAVLKVSRKAVVIDFSKVKPLQEFDVCVHPTAFTSKPERSQIASIKKFFGSANATPDTMNASSLAMKLIAGHTVSPGVLTGGSKASDWVNQQVFCLDFDNEVEDGNGNKKPASPVLTSKDVVDQCAHYNIYPAFLYSTFSSTKELPKFRAVFVSNRVITEPDECKRIYQSLLALFPEADQSCKNLDRIFFGGKKLLYENYRSTFSPGRVVSTHKPKNEPGKKKSPGHSLSNDELRSLAKNFDLLSYIRGTGQYSEEELDDRISFNPCPLCGHQDDFYYYPETNSYSCYGAHGDTSGSIIDFIMAQRQISQGDAIRLFKEMCGYDNSNPFQRDLSNLRGIHEDSIMYGKNGLANDESEIGLARAFAARYSSVLCHNSSWGWIYWDGMKWDTQAGGEAATRLYIDLMDEITTDIGAAIVANPAESSLQKDLKWAQGARAHRPSSGTLKLAQAFMQIPMTQFDADAYDLNTPAGIVNLKTGEIRPHDSEAYCTKITAVSPNMEESGRKIWMDFLKWVTCGDKELAVYLRHVAGMAAIGAVNFEAMIMAYGTGANGKSTLWNAIQEALGTYAATVSPEMLMTRKSSGQDVPGLASVQGKRLVLAAETEEGNRIASSTLKRLSSTDTMSAKRLYKDPFEFKPTHTLVLSTNHLPKIGSIDDGTWRRVIAVPFRAKRKPSEAKLNYADDLVRDAGGYILAWVIRGARDFLKTDAALLKNPPEVVRQATEEYRQSENWVENFIDACCDREPNARTRTGELFAAYKSWCDRTNEYCRRIKDFTPALEDAGYKKIVPKNKPTMIGLKLKER